MSIHIAYYRSPIGILRLEEESGYLTKLKFVNYYKNISESSPVLSQAIEELDRYFSGEIVNWKTPIKPEGTDFQQSVWKALQEISYGETVSYAYIAKAINNPRAVRAVGGANNKNPIPIIIPCHRVIGKDGSLTGYGGGLNRKRWLLNHEATNK